MNPFELRDQGDYSETIKNGWIRLCVSISQENKTAQETSSRKSALGIPIKIYV